MLDIRFVPADLRKLDELGREALLLPVFLDERPLRGALGLVDWRLCGRISELLRGGRFSGKAGEKLLLPVRRRLSVEKLFLFGTGVRADFGDAAFDSSVGQMLETLRRAKVRSSVCALPGRSTGEIEAGPAMTRFLRLAAQQSGHDEITLIEELPAQKEMAPVIQQERRRVRAQG